MSFRLIPLIIIACIVLLVVKVAERFHDGGNIEDVGLASEVFAQENAEKDVEKKEGEEDSKEVKANKDEDKEKGEGGDEAGAKEAIKGDADNKEGDASEEDEENNYIEEKDISTLTPTELDILRRLSERRKRLLDWEKNLKTREHILHMTEDSIDKKLEELRELQSQVEERLVSYNDKEQEKINSLVKIYENMKPKKAADIFMKMDTGVLLQVVDKMKEKSVAAIFGKMDPAIAKRVTERFAVYGRLPSVEQ